MIAPPDYLAGHRGGNFVVVASDAPLAVNELSASLEGRGSNSVVIVDAEVARFASDADVLTDNFAPVDQLITS